MLLLIFIAAVFCAVRGPGGLETANFLLGLLRKPGFLFSGKVFVRMPVQEGLMYLLL